MEESLDDDDDFEDDDDDYLNLNEDEGKLIICLNDPPVLIMFHR